MERHATTLLKEALRLSAHDRAALAEALLVSLDEDVDDVDAAWRSEVERRIAELDSGSASPIPWHVVRQRLFERARRRALRRLRGGPRGRATRTVYNRLGEQTVKQVDNAADSRVLWSSEDGQSRLHNVDCLEFMKTLPADSVDCIWTDPPYLLSNDGITCIAGKMVKVNKGEWDRSRGVDLDHEFNRTWLAACHRVLKPSGAIWVSGTLHVYLSVGMAMQQLGFRILNDIVWEKPAPPPNLGCRCFTHATEILLWATKAKKGGRDRHKFNYEAMKEENAGKQMKSVWRFSTPSDEEKRFGKHPTQKPLALIARCLRATTDPGDLVLDPFSGSASTGVAALKLGRHFVGCEQDETYAKLAARRLNEAAPGEIVTDATTASASGPRGRQQALFAKA